MNWSASAVELQSSLQFRAARSLQSAIIHAPGRRPVDIRRFLTTVIRTRSPARNVRTSQRSSVSAVRRLLRPFPAGGIRFLAARSAERSFPAVAICVGHHATTESAKSLANRSAASQNRHAVTLARTAATLLSSALRTSLVRRSSGLAVPAEA